jgi:hypothetical protein
MEQEQPRPPDAPRPTRAERATDFLRSGTGLVAAVTALVVAVGGLATALTQLGGDGSGEDTRASHEDTAGSPGPGGGTETAVLLGSASQRELLAHVPAEIRSSCGPPRDPEDGAAAAINCTYRERVGLQYNLFASSGELEEAYAEVKRRYGLEGELDGESCAAGSFEGEHRAGDRAVGRVICFVDEPGHVAAIVWTHEELDVLSFAWRDDLDLTALHDTWRRGVGPDA